VVASKLTARSGSLLNALLSLQRAYRLKIKLRSVAFVHMR